MSAYPGYDDGKTPGAGTTQYLGDVPHARRPKSGPFGVPMPGVTQKGYKKGDQNRLLPKNGADLAALQRALYQTGYFTEEAYGRVVLGSPDPATAAAFAKLLATANMSGTSWQDALGSRLAAAAYQAEDEEKETPPLTIELTNPEDIKATLQNSAKKLLGGYMSEDQANAFVAQFQGQQAAAQTQSHYQQYTPGVGYGPGGMTTAAPSLDVASEKFAKDTDPDQYSATQLGTSVSDALTKLRNTGYL